jgi:hypothetical protein
MEVVALRRFRWLSEHGNAGKKEVCKKAVPLNLFVINGIGGDITMA